MNRSDRQLHPLNARAHEIFQWIGEGGLATRSQLTRRFWPHAQPHSAWKQLYRWIQMGYLVCQDFHIPQRGTALYALTPLSSTALQLYPPAIYVGWPSSGEYPHLIFGQEARLMLEQQLADDGGAILQWRGDRLLHHRARIGPQENGEIPDAEAVVRLAPGRAVETWAVEIDGDYHGAMLAAKAANYGQQPHLVIWACRSRRAATVQAAIQPYPNIRLLVFDQVSPP